MLGLDHGFKRAIVLVVNSLVIGALVTALLGSGLLEEDAGFNLKLFYTISGVIFLIESIIAIKYWSAGYIIGFAIGAIVLWHAGIPTWELVVMGVCAVAVLLERFR